MTDLIPSHMVPCACASNKIPCPLCCDILCFEENGKRVKLVPRRGERAIALVLDQCVFRDQHLKCDGLFVLSQVNRTHVFLVELKGTDIVHAYEQISFVLTTRPEYQEIVEYLRASGTGGPVQKSFIVSNGVLGTRNKQKLENEWGVRPVLITGQKPADKAPDLRDQRYFGR